MKFLENHRKDISAVICQNEMDQQAFSYVKRKGRINVIHNPTKKYFAYLRKKETSINELSHQWEDKTYYKVQKDDHEEIIIETWEAVVLDFKKWIRLLI